MARDNSRQKGDLPGACKFAPFSLFFQTDFLRPTNRLIVLPVYYVDAYDLLITRDP
jgi:hypothetical protein